MNKRKNKIQKPFVFSDLEGSLMGKSGGGGWS